VVGPTACGKSDVGIALCRTFGGEVVSADSRQVYRGLDLGTGKVVGTPAPARGRTVSALGSSWRIDPLMSDGVDHWLLDVEEPATVFTAAAFQVLAYDAIADIAHRGRVPVVVGGTGLYVRAVVDALVMPSVAPDPALREALGDLDAAALRSRLLALDPAAGAVVDLDNPRRMVRAIEVATAAGALAASRGVAAVPFRALTLGVRVERPDLLERIQRRLLARLEAGMVDEVRTLAAGGLTHARMEDLGLEYRYISRYLRGALDHASMVDELCRAIARFARRQATWFRKHGPVVWVDTVEAATQAVAAFLHSTA